MVAISFSFLFCLSQKLWEEEEMKPLSIGKQDNKFYEWFYVRFVTETENLDQICSIWQLGQVWEWKIENWRWQQPKTEELLGFYDCWKWQTKTKNYTSSAYVSRRGRSISDSKFRESNDSPEPKFQSCDSVSHRTSENFHPAPTETEPVTSSEGRDLANQKISTRNF